MKREIFMLHRKKAHSNTPGTITTVFGKFLPAEQAYLGLNYY